MPRKIAWLTIVLTMFACFPGFSQYSKYIVRLKDKAGNPFSISNPSAYLSQRAIERRTRYNIAIDSTDLPITPRYIDSIRAAGNVTILNVSKWLNQVAIQTSDAGAIARIRQLPFVLATEPLAARMAITPVDKRMETDLLPVQGTPSTGRLQGYYNYGMSNGQVTIHQGDFLHNHGFRGQNMQVAVLDAGFYNYQNLPTFDSIRNNNQILGTWDFVANEASVGEDNSHGMHCLSTMAANLPGRFVGTSPGASFYLFRTEDVASEYPIEEQNWTAAAERSDSLGVDVISVSLGYTEFDDPIFNYTYQYLNGHNTLIARASNMAMSKGMLIVAAAGNEGNGSWQYITTPADADSILTVGAVDTLGNVAGFSGYGPNSSGQTKPEVAAVGWLAIVANGNTGQPAYSNGTSFACPNMAGIATCLWQAFPEVSNRVIRQTLMRSSTRYSNPDDRVGYGIPDAKKAFVLLQKLTYSNQSAVNNCRYDISFNLKTDNSMRIDLERKNSLENSYQVIHQFTEPGAYGMHQYSFSDDLSGIDNTTNAYRLVVYIGADTSYILDSTPSPIPVCNSISTDDFDIIPNPFSGYMTVRSTMLTSSYIRLVLHNSLGQKVRELTFNQSPGIRISRFPMTSLAKGVYFITGYVNNKKLKTVKAVNR